MDRPHANRGFKVIPLTHLTEYPSSPPSPSIATTTTTAHHIIDAPFSFAASGAEQAPPQQQQQQRLPAASNTLLSTEELQNCLLTRTSAVAAPHPSAEGRRSSRGGPAAAKPSSGSSITDHLRQWQALGVDTARFLPAATAAPARPPPPLPAAPTVSGAEEEARLLDEATTTLCHKLRDVSGKVQEAQEAQRCGPPRQEGRRGGGPARHFGQAKGKKKDGDDAPPPTAKRPRTTAPGSADGAGPSGEEETNQKKRPAARRKKGTAAAPVPPSTTAPRTLFRFEQPGSTPHPAASPSAVAAAEVPLTTLTDTDALFQDMETVLRDPDRIQAPPLFAGLLLDGGHDKDGEPCSNFSLSAASAGRLPFPADVLPNQAHLHVRDVVLRWKDAVYRLPAQPGLALLLRVLRELPGVELVTFNAVVLLLPLLALTGADLSTHCVSDVRTMAWMAHLQEEEDGSDAATADFAAVLRLTQPRSAGVALLLDAAPSAAQRLARHVYHLAATYRALYGQLGTKGQLQAFLRQEKRVALLLAVMKYNGVVVRAAEVERFRESCTQQMALWRERAAAMVPQMVDFNIQSTDQCRDAIYDVLDLGKYLEVDSVSVTKGGKLSTAEETLRRLAAHHPFPQALLAYRRAAKLLQTYIEGMMRYAVPYYPPSLPGAAEALLLADEGGAPCGGPCAWLKVHPNFLQEGTDTGRLSCVAPNLQSVPRTSLVEQDGGAGGGGGGDAPYSFRCCFAVPPGWVYLSADYQQIELRVLAHLCGDAALVDALTKSTDIHRTIAEAIFRRSPVTSEERSLAKKVVFGSLYGAGPQLLAAQANIEVERAQHIAGQLRRAYPQIEIYHQRVVEQSRVDGYVRTLSGRLRLLPDLHSSVAGKRAYAERQAFNTVIQGSAADVMKAAMLAVEKSVLQRWPAEVQLCMQIHDEMVLCVRREQLPAVVPAVCQAMGRAMSLLVPLQVTAKYGPSLGNLTEWSVDHELGLIEV